MSKISNKWHLAHSPFCDWHKFGKLLALHRRIAYVHAQVIHKLAQVLESSKCEGEFNSLAISIVGVGYLLQRSIAAVSPLNSGTASVKCSLISIVDCIISAMDKGILPLNDILIRKNQDAFVHRHCDSRCERHCFRFDDANFCHS